jgi:hypothetical protein
MKTYSDLTDIDPRLNLTINIEPVGLPDTRIVVNRDSIDYPGLSAPITLDYRLSLLDPIDIDIRLSNKHYTTEYETAVIFKIYIDNIEIIPKYNYLAEYVNDHDNNNPTHYLGFNGKWTLTIDRPFYQWLHQAQKQGWLIG